MPGNHDQAIHDMGVAALAAAIRDGALTAEAVAQACLAQAERAAGLNAFAFFDADAVLADARAADRARAAGGTLPPLCGVPLTLKDNIDTTALPTAAGTPALRDHRPKRNAPVAQALFDAGAILFGKAGMHELAYGITSNNAAFGAVRNPYDPSRVPGGSSGGTGAAVGARIVPAGIGTDTGGSVRVPAAFCGVMGLRPTTGRWPQAGIVPISSTRDTAGPLARTVADLALLDGIVTGEDAPLPSKAPGDIRLGVPQSHFWEGLDEETGRLCRDALARLRDAGIDLVEVDLPGIAELTAAIGFPIVFHEGRVDLDAYLAAAGLDLRSADIAPHVASPDVKGLFDALLAQAPEAAEAAWKVAVEEQRPRLIAAYRDGLAKYGVDAFVFPTVPLPAPPIGDDEETLLNGQKVPTFMTTIRNTDPGSNAGVPGISLPAGITAAGLPVALELDGPPGGDRALLAVAETVAAALPAIPAPKI